VVGFFGNIHVPNKYDQNPRKLQSIYKFLFTKLSLNINNIWITEYFKIVVQHYIILYYSILTVTSVSDVV